MKRIMMFAVAAMFVCGFAFGQENVEENSILPSDVVDELQYFVGEWTAEGEAARGAIEGNWIAKWAPGGQCLVLDYRGSLGGEAFRSDALWGWDSANKELLLVSFFTLDALEVIRTKVDSPGVYRGSYTGQVKGEPFKAKAEYKKEGENAWTFKSTDATVGGKKVKGVSVKFTRRK